MILCGLYFNGVFLWRLSTLLYYFRSIPICYSQAGMRRLVVVRCVSVCLVFVLYLYSEGILRLFRCHVILSFSLFVVVLVLVVCPLMPLCSLILSFGPTSSSFARVPCISLLVLHFFGYDFLTEQSFPNKCSRIYCVLRWTGSYFLYRLKLCSWASTSCRTHTFKCVYICIYPKLYTYILLGLTCSK